MYKDMETGHMMTVVPHKKDYVPFNFLKALVIIHSPAKMVRQAFSDLCTSPFFQHT